MNESALLNIVSENTKIEGVNPSFMESIQFLRIDDSYTKIRAVLEPCIFVMLNGQKVLKIGEKPIVLNPNSLILATSKLIVESEYRCITKADPGYGVIIRISQKILRDLIIGYEKFNSNDAVQDEQTALIDKIDLSNELSEKLLRLVQSSSKPESAYIIGEQLLKEFYYTLLKSPVKNMLFKLDNLSGKGQEVAKVIHFFEENIDKKITVNDITKLSGLSSSVLYDKFKTMTNLSPMQFLKDLRLDHARTLILSGHPVSQSAYDAGYNNLSQFSREFKRKFGISPKDVSKSKFIY